MKGLVDELDLGVGEMHYALEAVQFGGETLGHVTFSHEAKLAQKLNAIVEKIGGKVTGDAALYLSPDDN